jgi:hypothetical protein
MKKNYSRRKFIKSTIGAGVAIAGTGMAFAQVSGSEKYAGTVKNQYDPKGLPTSVLGKTGVVIPRIAIGLGRGSSLLLPSTKLSKCAIMPLIMDCITGILPMTT